MFISVKEDPELTRDGYNIRSTVEIPFTDAILGTVIKTNTVDGPVDLRIPAGTQPNTTLLMAKRGVPKMNQGGSRGDHLVRVKVTIPQKLSGEEKELVEALAETLSKSAAAPKSGGGWFGRKKDN